MKKTLRFPLQVVSSSRLALYFGQAILRISTLSFLDSNGLKQLATKSALLLFLVFFCNAGAAWGQISITNFTALTQDFNTLANTGTSMVLPPGWSLSESGSNMNTSYSAGTGSGTASDTYSFGAASSTERAFGGLQSGTLVPTIGVQYINNTGAVLTSFTITYTGEQWRLGAINRVDRLDFQYSLDASSLTTGVWTDNNALDFTAPITTGSTGALDGNLTANRTAITATITGLSIANGATFWLRWNDFNATGSDDGLGIDDYSFQAICTPPLIVITIAETSGNNNNDGIICSGASATLTASGGTSYAWSTGSMVASAIVNPSFTTSYTVTVTDTGGCANTASTTITVSPPATVNAGSDQTTCVNGVIQLPGTVGGSATGGTWTASVGGGYFSPNSNTLAAYYTPPAGYTNPITLTLTTTGPCAPASDAMVVTFGVLPPLNLTAIPPASATCSDQVTFTIRATNGFTGISSLQYSVNWDPTKLQYVTSNATVIGGGAPGIGSFNVTGGQLTVAWFDPAGTTGESLADGTTLLTITMKVLASTGTVNLNITSVPTPIEASNFQFCTLPVNVSNAALSVTPITVNCPAAQALCIDAGSFTLSGGMPAGGAYAGDGVSAGDFDPFAAGPGPHTITYTYTNGNNCTNSCTFVVTVNDRPVVDCPTNFSVIFTAPPFTLSGGMPMGGDYGGDGVSGGVFDPNDAGLGDHNIDYSYTDANGCTNVCTFTITVSQFTNVTCPPDFGTCINTPAFTLTGGLPTGGTYTGTGLSGGQFDPAVAGVGAQVITYTYIDGGGNSGSCMFTITVQALPVVTCPANSSVCVNAPVFMLSGGMPIGGTYSGTGVSGGSFDPSLANLGANTITYSYTDGNGCTNTCTFTITVHALPVVTCPANSSVCVNTPAFSLSGGAPAGGTYSGTGVSGGSFDPSLANLGANTITYSYTDGNGCTNTCTFTITVHALPVVTCPANSSVCVNAPAFSLSGGAPAGGTYSGTGVSGGSFDPSLANLGANTITYSYTDGNSCTNTCTFTITVHALPVVTCPANSSVCVNTPAFSLSGGAPAGGTYSGTGVSGGSFDPSFANLAANTITYSYTDGNGCTSTCTFTITVHALPVVTCPANSSVCVNAPAFSLSGGAPAGGTYSGTGVIGGSFDPSFANLGANTITYSYTDGNGCTSTCTFTITVHALPVVTCPANSSVCVNAPVFSLSGGAPAGGTYSGTGVSGGSFDPSLANLGANTITYSYTDGNGCTNTCTFTFTVHALPVVTCPANSGVCLNTPTFTLSGGTPIGGTYSGTGVSSGMFDPSMANLGANTITYSYTDGNSCTSTCTFTITVNALPVVTCPANSGVCLNIPTFTLSGGAPMGGTYSGTGVSGGTFNPSVAGVGPHVITYTYSDGTCSNSCTFAIRVDAPTVVCKIGLSLNIMPTGMVQLYATDVLLYAEDSCTLNPILEFGIRKCGQGSGFPLDVQSNPITNVVFDCTELGTQCVELWVIDQAGHANYCETNVIVQDNNGNCIPGGHINVSGALKTEPVNGNNGDGVANGNVEIAGSVNPALPFSFHTISNAQGIYALNNAVPTGADITITPIKDDNPLNGVTTYDLVLISKHILGIEPLGSPYKLIAADANKSNSITTFDVVELRKLILGIYQELPNNTSWRFVDKSHVFQNPLNPFMNVIPENISIANVPSNQLNQDFVGVKIGDVNNTVVPSSAMMADDRMMGTLLFDVSPTPALPEGEGVRAGEEFEVTFTADQEVQGYQMTLNLNGLEVSEIVGNDKVTANNFGILGDALTVSIDGADAFTVKFRATKAGKLSEMVSVSSRITKAEGYVPAEALAQAGSVADGRLDVALRFDSKTIAGVGFELYQNQPNPFVNKTFVGFHLPEATTATLTVYDAVGRVVFTQKGDFAKGYNGISLDHALINTTGVLYYTLETATNAATKKMIQLK